MIGFIASVLLAATSTIPDEVREQFGERMSAMGEPAQVLALSCIGHTIIAHDLEQFADTNPAFLRYDEGQAKPFLMGRPARCGACTCRSRIMQSCWRTTAPVRCSRKRRIGLSP